MILWRLLLLLVVSLVLVSGQEQPGGETVDTPDVPAEAPDNSDPSPAEPPMSEEEIDPSEELSGTPAHKEPAPTPEQPPQPEIPAEKPETPALVPEPKESVPKEEEPEFERPIWGYTGQYPPWRWSEVNSTCSPDSLRQSPISINSKQTIFEDEMNAISFYEKINRLHKHMILKHHKKYTVKIEFPHEAIVQGGNLPSHGFQVMGAKFTWGSDNTKGSEHQVDGKYFPLEMQLYAYDTTQSPSMKDAMEGTNSLAAFSVLFKLDVDDNPLLSPIIKGLKKIRNPGQETSIPFRSITSLVPVDTKSYFRYMGSLPMPPCCESVVWTVLLKTHTVSEAQLEEFRQLIDHVDDDGTIHPLVDNARPIQPIHDRLIYRSFLFRSEMSRIEVPKGASQLQGGSTRPAIGIAMVLSIVLISVLEIS